MSQKIIYVCDICGQEKTPKGGLRVDIYHEISPKSLQFNDICGNCFSKIKQYIDEMRNVEEIARKQNELINNSN